jgi:hypothetical protein
MPRPTPCTFVLRTPSVAIGTPQSALASALFLKGVLFFDQGTGGEGHKRFVNFQEGPGEARANLPVAVTNKHDSRSFDAKVQVVGEAWGG